MKTFQLMMLIALTATALLAQPRWGKNHDQYLAMR